MRLYHALLALYPTRFREEYGEELSRAFEERTRGRSRLSIWLAAFADIVPNAIAAHWDILRHDTAAGTTLPAFGSDVRFAFRQIRRAPLLSCVVIVVIALGIGVNAGLLTILNVYAWQAAPGIASDGSLARLTSAVWWEKGRRFTETSLSYPDIVDLRQQRSVFDDVTAWTSSSVAVDFGSGSESVVARYTTSNYFRSLGVRLSAGTGFTGGDADRSSAMAVVIGHSFWISEFAGASDIIGKTIRVMDVPVTIVGVAPPLFTGVDVMNMDRPTIWLPLAARAILEPETANHLARRDKLIFRSVARLARGVTAEAVEHATAALALRLAQQEPETHNRLTIRAERLTGIAESSADRRELVAAMALVAALILVITCTNVSALLLGRASARRREIGVRLSMGATRFRIIRQMLTESLVHALAGAALGMALYIPIIKIAYVALPGIVYGLQPKPATFLYATLFALAATVVFGLAPALHATSADIGAVIKNSGSQAIRRSRLQRIFVVIQLACSQPVLIVTSLVLADIRHDTTQNANRAPSSVLTMSSTNYRPEPSDAATSPTISLVEAMRQHVSSIPGVQSVTVSTPGIKRALMIRYWGTTFEPVGSRGAAAASRLNQLYISDDYFATYGIPLVQGRGLGPQDRTGLNVILNESAARTLWPGEDPIGKRFVRRDEGDSTFSATLEVVGIVGTAPHEKELGSPMVYAPLSTAASAWQSTIAVRTKGDARPYLPLIRAAISEIDAYATIDEVQTLAERYARERSEAAQANAAALLIGAVALALASVGLYAIIAFSVTQRTREIGVRVAMGATKGRVVRHFFRDGIVAAGIGLAIGLPLTVIGIRVVQARALGFTLQDVGAVMLVVPVLAAVAALASWLPARRAGRVDPVIALRTE